MCVKLPDYLHKLCNDLLLLKNVPWLLFMCILCAPILNCFVRIAWCALLVISTIKKLQRHRKRNMNFRATSGARLLQICSDGLVRDICKIKLWGFPASWVLNCYIISIHTIFEFAGNLWRINGGFSATTYYL